MSKKNQVVEIVEIGTVNHNGNWSNTMTKNDTIQTNLVTFMETGLIHDAQVL